MTRDELINKVVKVANREWQRPDRQMPMDSWDLFTDVARALDEARLLRDPALEPSAVDVLATVREKLGTPEGRAVSVHAAEVRAELEQLRAKVEELTDFAGEQANARRESDRVRNLAAREAADLRDERDTARAELAEKTEYAGEKAREGDVLSLQVDDLTAERDALQARLDAQPSTATVMVREFHEAFGVAVDAADTSDLREFRFELIAEEFSEVQDELLGASYDDDTLIRPPGTHEAIAQELADLVYVVYGTAVSLGIDLDEAIRRVHASNMSKRNPDGTVTFREDGKVLKPPTYQRPDMTGVVRAALQGDQTAEPETHCMNGSAKQHTLRMVAIIKALKAAAVNGQLPATAEPLPFAQIARAIVDHWTTGEVDRA